MAWWSRFTRRDSGHESMVGRGELALPSWYMTTFPTSDRESLGTSFSSYVVDGYQSNGVVFAVLNTRLYLIAQADFKFQDKATLRLFGTPSLSLLEEPWPNGTSGDLLARMEQDVSLAGNAYVRRATPTMLERLRPDLVDIVTVEHESGVTEVIGYAYWRAGRGSGEADYYAVDEVAHWAPIPDPLASFRGMSWLTPVVREVNADVAMTDHKVSFFRNAATPNMLIRVPGKMSTESADRLAAQVTARHGGAANAWRTMVIDDGADVTMIGSTFDKMAFTAVQAAGEVRVCVAAGVAPQAVGLQAGLDSGTYANYDAALKATANGVVTYLWRSAVAALSKLVDVPPDARLWFDTGNIPALQAAETARAEASATAAGAVSTLIQAGYEADAAVAAVNAADLSLLAGKHTGLVSVQMQAPGATPNPTP